MTNTADFAEAKAGYETAKALILECGMTKVEALTLLMSQRMVGRMISAGWCVSQRDVADCVRAARAFVEDRMAA